MLPASCPGGQGKTRGERELKGTLLCHKKIIFQFSEARGNSINSCGLARCRQTASRLLEPPSAIDLSAPQLPPNATGTIPSVPVRCDSPSCAGKIPDSKQNPPGGRGVRRHRNADLWGSSAPPLPQHPTPCEHSTRRETPLADPGASQGAEVGGGPRRGEEPTSPAPRELRELSPRQAPQEGSAVIPGARGNSPRGSRCWCCSRPPSSLQMRPSPLQLSLQSTRRLCMVLSSERAREAWARSCKRERGPCGQSSAQPGAPASGPRGG